MTEPSGNLRRLPWTGHDGRAEYAAPGESVDHLADRTEADILSMARNDAAYARIMAEHPETSQDQLRSLVGTLARAVQDVANVADLRGERLNSPAAKALEDALRAALGGH